MMTHPLLPKLRQLKLSAMVQTLDVRAAQAQERGLTPVEFLALLLDDEIESLRTLHLPEKDRRRGRRR